MIKRRHRSYHARLRSTIHRFGITRNPLLSACTANSSPWSGLTQRPTLRFAGCRTTSTWRRRQQQIDMAHIAGLVAGGAHPSPIPHADIVTCTTTKTLRGPRGGMILARDERWRKKLQAAVFPGVQGSIHTQVIAAKAVCLGEALQPEFRVYAHQVKNNAARLAAVLADGGLAVVTGGTDTHIVLLDLADIGMTGQAAERVLERSGITTNKNPIPFDVSNPAKWSGLRIGVAAATTRGFREAEMEQLGQVISSLLTSPGAGDEAQRVVARLCRSFPLGMRTHDGVAR